MIPAFFKRTTTGDPGDGPQHEGHRQRFEQYFPGAFAYVSSWLGDDPAARQIVVETFTRTFAFRAELTDEDFPILLFATARDLCHSGADRGRLDDGLSGRERDVISLLFDAQLTRGQVSVLLGLKHEQVNATLIRALKKLRAKLPGAATSALAGLT